MQKLIDLFARNKAAIFCGAGISLAPPAGLPNWHMLRDYTLETLAAQDEVLATNINELTDIEMFAAPGKKGLTPEVVASEIANHNQGYFECFRALEIAKEIGDKQGVAIRLNNIAQIYTASENYDQALQYYQEYENTARVLGDKKGIATASYNIAMIYMSKSDIAQAQKYLSKYNELKENQ